MTKSTTFRKLAMSATLATAAAFSFAASAFATEYPDRPITLIVPWGAGARKSYNTRNL